MLSKETIVVEYMKCIQDPKYAITTYLKTFDKTQEGFVPFKLFPRQKEIVDACIKFPENIIAKPRQAGVSTTVAAFLATRAVFADPENPETILIIANKLKLAQKFLGTIKDFAGQFPRWIWGEEYYGTDKAEDKDIFVKNSMIEFELPNKSKVIAVATSTDALRGYTPTYLVFDEAAFIDNGEEVYATAVSSLSTGGRCILISTPRGQDSLYYKTYEQAKAKQNNYNIVEMRWYEDPRYNKDLKWYKTVEEELIIEVEDEFTYESFQRRIDDGFKPRSSWYDDMCKKMNNDARRIAQELDVSFVGSGGNIIRDEYIEYQRTHNQRDPLYTSGEKNEYWIWEKPIDGHQYIMACLPPNEKVLTDKGLMNIEDVTIHEKLINENGDYVNIINKQIYPVLNEDIFEIKLGNTYRTTKFTKEHPILVSKSNLKRHYNKSDDKYKFNERYWDFKFEYRKANTLEINDWIKVPNIYKKELNIDINEKWLTNQFVRKDFKIKSPLLNESFWWFVGLWLGDGWLCNHKDSFSITICFNKNEYFYVDKLLGVIKSIFDRVPSITERETVYNVTFNSKELYYFLLDNFGQYSHGKKISEWVKFIPYNSKLELIKGYFDSDGSWIKIQKNKNVNSKISFVSINLELLESFQDILFSVGIISSLNKLRDAETHKIRNKIINSRTCYNLALANFDSLKLISLLSDSDDIKLNKFNINEFDNKNKRMISGCHFSNDENFIYFKITNINKSEYTGNVYNFECDTHTFMCHHITTHNCDVASGVGDDYSAIQIIDFTTMEQVMEYRGKIQPDLFAEIVYEYGNLYKAYSVVDNVGVGSTTVLKLVEMGYKYLHYDTPKTKLLRDYRSLQKFSQGEKIPGFNVSTSRLMMINHLEQMVRENTIKIRSKRVFSEMKTFVIRGGRPDHMKGYHDDALNALAMALWVLESHFKNLQKFDNQTKAMLSSWVMTNGTTDTNQSKTGYTPNKNNQRQNPYGDNLWLFGGMK